MTSSEQERRTRDSRWKGKIFLTKPSQRKEIYRQERHNGPLKGGSSLARLADYINTKNPAYKNQANEKKKKKVRNQFNSKLLLFAAAIEFFSRRDKKKKKNEHAFRTESIKIRKKKNI